MATMASLLWQGARFEYIVTLHGNLPPAPAEWTKSCALFPLAKTPSDLRGLIITTGGGPNAQQRKTVSEAHAKSGVKRDAVASVISDSALVRGVITALGWLGTGQGMRAFRFADANTAFAYIGITPEDIPRLLIDLTSAGASIADGNPMNAFTQRR